MKLFWILFMIYTTTKSAQYSKIQRSYFKRTSIKLMIFAKKTAPKQLSIVKQNCVNNINTIFYKINEYVFHYNTLPEDDRYIIETLTELFL